MTQSDLFGEPVRARRSDPSTSQDAAERASQFAHRHFDLILSALRRFPKGLTVHEIAATCCLDVHAVARRTPELEAAERIATRTNADGTPMTRPTPSGRSARVWWIPQ